MKVFKFGGASVKDASAVKNMAGIVLPYATKQPILVVVSAMGKTTNALEKLLDDWLDQQQYADNLNHLKAYHLQIAQDLFPANGAAIFQQLEASFIQLEHLVTHASKEKYDEDYDQVVGMGEVISTYLVSAYLQQTGIACQWLDAREFIRTDTRWREGKVDWDWSEKLITKEVLPLLSMHSVVTQGFIGGTVGKKTTTLGREGSDYSAAIFAYCLKAESLTIWKDVPGILNADPKLVEETHLYPQLSYNEAAEMTYYGATVIHPKTIKPLANRKIPLYVRSFIHPASIGTQISDAKLDYIIPAIIFKPHQCLISFGVRDFTFITEKNLSTILHALANLNIKINMMQNSAISFSICTDQQSRRIIALKESLQDDFAIYFNENLQLITVKHYDEATIQQVIDRKEILLEQKTRHTFQVLVRE
ncbi:MAG: aspartate kinase [Bacteroidota bacterium]